ncbi:MAG TPA: DUF2530 domain-containing protein [Jiangellaceae bacterium]
MANRRRRTRETPRVEPLDVDGVRTVAIFTVIWAVVFVVLAVRKSALDAAGNGWWLWTCLAGVGLGLLGLEYTRKRRDAIALAELEAEAEADEVVDGGEGADDDVARPATVEADGSGPERPESRAAEGHEPERPATGRPEAGRPDVGRPAAEVRPGVGEVDPLTDPLTDPRIAETRTHTNPRAVTRPIETEAPRPRRPAVPSPTTDTSLPRVGDVPTPTVESARPPIPPIAPGRAGADRPAADRPDPGRPVPERIVPDRPVVPHPPARTSLPARDELADEFGASPDRRRRPEPSASDRPGREFPVAGPPAPEPAEDPASTGLILPGRVTPERDPDTGEFLLDTTLGAGRRARNYDVTEEIGAIDDVTEGGGTIYRGRRARRSDSA